MKTIIQKYGGTSVRDIERITAIAERISEQQSEERSRLAVVVSAMAGETNRLVELVKRINPEANPIHYDMAVSSGEQVTCALLAAALERKGLKAQPFLGHQLGIKTDGFHSTARITHIKTEVLEKCWSQDTIAIVAGFQGVSPDDQITTLGRGGSDTTAVALAAATKADLCEINTDVDGVFTADPRIAPGARPISVMNYETALEMASLGSKVLHSRCVELAAKFQVNLSVRDTFMKSSKGTRIMSMTEQDALEAPVVSGVASVSKVAKITLSQLPTEPNIVSKVFQSISDAKLNIDIIVHDVVTSDDTMRIGFSLNDVDAPKAKEVSQKTLAELGIGGVSVTSEEGFAKVSVVGLGMRSHSGVAARVFKALRVQQVAMHMISTSEIKISCLVHGEQEAAAVNALHKEFCEDE